MPRRGNYARPDAKEAQHIITVPEHLGPIRTRGDRQGRFHPRVPVSSGSADAPKQGEPPKAAVPRGGTTGMPNPIGIPRFEPDF